MHYLIDGYNLLFHFHEEPGKVEEARLHLVDLLGDLFHSLKIKSSIIFDNRYAHALDVPSHQVNGDFEIVFTPKGLTADEYIIELLEAKKHLALETVVTSDRGLIAHVKELGAKVKTIEEFSAWLKKKKTFKLKSRGQEKLTHDSKAHIARLLKIFSQGLED